MDKEQELLEKMRKLCPADQRWVEKLIDLLNSNIPFQNNGKDTQHSSEQVE
jgi:mRNA-degrading endonuclease RelE of RelBE toxin-antitoxin system